jgi:hypothetical protein
MTSVNTKLNVKLDITNLSQGGVRAGQKDWILWKFE